MSDYKVALASPEEFEAVKARLLQGPFIKPAHRTAILQGGIELKGSFEMTAREVDTGEVAWTHKDENLITDFGRRHWMSTRFNTFPLGFSSSIEPPATSRSSISDTLSQLFVSANLTVSNNPSTNTKTASTTFGTPASNRTLGTIFIGQTSLAVNGNGFFSGIIAYALLTPPKTQTTTQTLEVVYKISMSPIV